MGTLSGKTTYSCYFSTARPPPDSAAASGANAAARNDLERLQVRDDVGLFRVRKQIGVGRHPVSAGVDERLHVVVGDFLAVLQRRVLVETLQSRSHFLVFLVGVVASRALLENLFAFRSVALIGTERDVRHQHSRHPRRYNPCPHPSTLPSSVSL